MEFTVESLGPCLKRVVVKIPPERVQAAFDEQYEQINESVVMPGFRRGRAPRKVLEKRFAKTLGRDVREKLVQKALEELVEGKRVDPLHPPEIDLGETAVSPESPFEFTFELMTKPEFETPVYRGLEVVLPPVEVTAEEIRLGIDRLRRRVASLTAIPEGTVEPGDVLVVDWKAQDGESVVAKDTNVYYVVGRGVIGGFAAPEVDGQLHGQGPGAHARARVRVAADDPREELRGREFDLDVALKEVKRYVLPEIDAALLERLDYDDVEEMQRDVERRIRRAREREREREAEDAMVRGLLQGIEITLPESYVERELARWALRKRVSLQMEKTPEEEITKQIDAARDHARAHIEADMKEYFLLERIAEAEEVLATEAELLQAVREIADVYGQPEEAVLSSFREPERIRELAAQVRHRKVRELIRRAGTIVEGRAAPHAGGETAAEGKRPGKKTAKPRGAEDTAGEGAGG
jgi:trigger factor